MYSSKARQRSAMLHGRGAYARSVGDTTIPDVGRQIGFERHHEIDMNVNPNFVKQWKDLKHYAANYVDAETGKKAPFNEKQTGALLEPLIATLNPDNQFEGYVDEPQTWDGRGAKSRFPMEVKYKGYRHRKEPNNIVPETFDFTYLDDKGNYQRETFEQDPNSFLPNGKRKAGAIIEGAYLVDGFSSRQVTDVRDQKDLRTGVVVVYDQDKMTRKKKFQPPRVVYYDDGVSKATHLDRKWLQSDVGKAGSSINSRYEGSFMGPKRRRFVK